jgi:signal transduction histidine kinase
MARLAAVGELAAGVAHEINNPNGMIQRNLEFVGDVLDDALPLLAERDDAEQLLLGGVDLPMAREQLPLLLDDMVHGSRRISEIVRDLKDFARDDGLDSVTVFELNEAVSASLRLLDGTIRKATDEFRLSLGEGLPPVCGNLRQIEQVVLNLLQNACQALPSRDRGIAVATRYDASRRFVIVEVADEGVGMDASTLEKIFDPFFTTRRESGGTGLGLAVSKRIVRRHGGKLAAISTPGRGTTLTLTLPVSQEKP